MLIPNPHLAIIAPEKVRDYLLSPTHLTGRYKAAFFRKLGYTQAAWRLLRLDLRRLLSSDAELASSTEYGRKYLVRGLMGRHVGHRVVVTAVWIILAGENFPRLVTAYPGDQE